jgi:glycosyl transferase family 25
MEDWEQLILMSLCEHHIIANSTFSWWGAYLSNYNINKIVCYPDKWHHSNLITYSTVDLFPDNWTMCKTQRESIPYLLENVYYINLKDYEDRRINTENELKRMNWKYERFEAFKADDGRLGCCISHLKVIEMAKEKNLDYVVVVEDDILFTEPDKYNNMLVDFKNYIKLNNMTFDVLLFAASINTGGVKPITNNIYKASACFTTTGYIVNKHYYDKLIDNFKEAVGLLINNGETDIGCIDVNWIKLQKIDNWYILFPRTVNQRPSYSTIQKNNVNYSSMLLDNL